MTVLTFPSSPTIGQQYDAPNGIQYVFDGVKWTVLTVASTSAAVTDAVQDRVAPMFVNGPNTGINFTYNAGTNVMSAAVTAVNGNQLVNGVHEFTLESNGTLSLDGDPFVITSDSLVNSASSFSVSSDGTLTLTHPPESDPIVHPLSTTLTIQKAAGNYHTISGAYGLSLQATPVPSGYGLNTNTNFVDIFHDGISVNVNDNTWGFGTDGTLSMPLETKLNSGGVGEANSAEIGTTVVFDGPAIVNSEVFMGSGYGEFRSIYSKTSPLDSGLVYAGVEGFNYVNHGDVNFAGMVSQTPNIDSMYSVGLNESGQIVIGFTQNGQTLQSNDWSVVVGSLNTNMTVNGLFADTNRTVISSSGSNGIELNTDRGTVLFGNQPECVPTLLTHFHIMKDDPANVDLFFGDDSNYVKLPGNGETAYGVEIGTNVGSAYTWRFGTDGTLQYPHNAVQQATATVECLGNASTVVYTASGQYQHTIKLLIQVEGFVGVESWDTQACEMMVAKSFRNNDIASTVYGIVHTSTAPLATFTAQWNALTNRVEVLCATPSANSVYVRTFATEIYTAD